jgi:hypothetical protein
VKGIIQGLIWAGIWITAIILTVGVALVPFGLVAFLTFAGAQKREEKAQAALDRTLMRGEQLAAVAVQHRIFALWSRREIVGITNSRILILSRRILGGFTMKDIQWKDLEDATIDQNVLSGLCGSNLSFRHGNSKVGAVSVDGVPDDVATDIYAMAQAEEQAWEEKRRVRAMEEVRAAAGGVVVHTASGPAPTPAAPAGNRMIVEIEQAKRLLDMGTISDSEFQEMKSKILSAA